MYIMLNNSGIVTQVTWQSRRALPIIKAQSKLESFQFQEEISW